MRDDLDKARLEQKPQRPPEHWPACVLFAFRAVRRFDYLHSSGQMRRDERRAGPSPDRSLLEAPHGQRAALAHFLPAVFTTNLPPVYAAVLPQRVRVIEVYE